MKAGLAYYPVYFLIFLIAGSCTAKKLTMPNFSETYSFRLLPGQDLRKGIQQFVADHNIKAGWLVTCAGSLTSYAIRFANQNEGSIGTGHFEIVSLTGTLSVNGSHLHISISDSTGKTTGGHLLEGCKIFTTAEVVIGTTPGVVFKRVKDDTTGWNELQIE